MVLGATWPAIVAALAIGGLASLAGGPRSGLLVEPFALAVGLAVAYSTMARDGEYGALLQAGISPRRIGAVVVTMAAAIATVEAALACALQPPSVRTQYAGYVLMALQLPLLASMSLPISVRSRREEPWARMVLLLFAYVFGLVAVAGFGQVAGWAPGLDWFFIDVALAVADVMLYRDIARPRPQI